MFTRSHICRPRGAGIQPLYFHSASKDYFFISSLPSLINTAVFAALRLRYNQQIWRPKNRIHPIVGLTHSPARHRLSSLLCALAKAGGASPNGACQPPQLMSNPSFIHLHTHSHSPRRAFKVGDMVKLCKSRNERHRTY